MADGVSHTKRKQMHSCTFHNNLFVDFGVIFFFSFFLFYFFYFNNEKRRMQQFPVNKLLKRNTLHTSINQPHWMVCKYILDHYDESPNLARQRNTRHTHTLTYYIAA